MTSSVFFASSSSSKHRAIWRSESFVDSMPMKLTFSHGMPYLVSIISAI